jgi:hypothetical protein
MTIATLIHKTSPKALADKDFDKLLVNYLTYTGIKLSPGFVGSVEKKYKHLFDIPTFLGIEVEVEGINHKAVVPKFWDGKLDGSLRGPQEERTEFCTIPLTPRQAMVASAVLWNIMKDLGTPSFSWRTSVHDHLNVIDLKESELKSLMVLSSLFEPSLFHYVGKERAQSVFCVPLTESVSHYQLWQYLNGKRGLKALAAEDWYKYSSVNMARLIDRPHEPGIGTIEFRHMGGTGNINTVLRWHSILLQLFKASIAIPYSTVREYVLEISTSKHYRDLLYHIFDDDAAQHLEMDNFPNLYSGPIAKVKELFVPPKKQEPVKPKSALAAYASHIYKQQEKKRKKVPGKKFVSPLSGVTATATHILQEQAVSPFITVNLNGIVWNTSVAPPQESWNAQPMQTIDELMSEFEGENP